ncbi:MAG: hypothetical protein K2M60_07180 [Lachnospiraceae bacterium]|nr:hypothetical protein [Lachnospiraceae bacterium]MDE6254190.1 hypothetical protein [Lachnospiraceae bacterium]
MDINVRNRIIYISQIYMSAIFALLAVRSILLGRNDRMGIFYILASLMSTVIVLSVIKYAMTFTDTCMYSVLFSGCCYTALKCSDTSLYMVVMAITLLVFFIFVKSRLRHTGYNEPPAELFRVNMFILKILHFTFIFAVLFMGMESVTIFSIIQSILTVIFVNLLRYYIYHDMKNVVFIGMVLELAAVVCMIIIMPWFAIGNIVEFQMENTMTGYINRFLCALILSLLEIPFNPVWSFEKSLKG